MTDTDADGVVDTADECATTAPGEVANARGCSVAQTCPCSAMRNRGAYMGCVSKAATELRKQGRISPAQHGSTVSAAAQSGCGN